MKLKLSYDSQDEIPAGFEELYTENKDGKWVFTGVEGFDPESPTRLNAALTKERQAHKAAKEALAAYKALGSPEDLEAAVTERDELKLTVESSGNKPDDDQIAELVEKRVALKIKPIEQRESALKSQLAEAQQTIDRMNGERKQTTVRGTLEKTLREGKVAESAVPEIIAAYGSIFDIDDTGRVIAGENAGDLAGSDPKTWFDSVKSTKAHWFPPSVSGGATGAGGPAASGEGACFSHAGWNITQQMRLAGEKGAEYAQKIASRYGVDIKNPKRPEPPKSA